MNAEKLNEIKERAEKATSGPWRMAFGANYELAVRELDGGKFIADIDYESTNDAAFIAHAREDIPALVSEVERLQTRLDECEGLLSWAHDVLDDVHCYETDIYTEMSKYLYGDDSND